MKSKNNTPIAESGQFRLAKTTLGVLVALGCLNVSMATAAEEETAKATEEVEVINVTGMRSSIISAQEAKMDSNKIMDGISADDIGALPDRSVTETLQRVPGVAIDRYMSQGDPEHFSVEGSGVIVRGLTQVRSSLNGRNTFSATGGRTLSFEDVSPELLSAVNVYKTPSADQIEGGLAGSIDLETRMPLNESGQKIMFNTTVNYGDFAEEAEPEVSFLYSNSWDTEIGKIGLLVDVAHSKLQTRNDSIYVRPYFARELEGYEETMWVPRGTDWRTMNFARERNGQYVALQWQPADNHKLSFTYFNSEYDMQWDEDAIFVDNWGPGLKVAEDAVFDDNNVFVSGSTYQDGGIQMGADIRVAVQESKTTDYALEYKYFNDSFELSASLQHVESESKGLDSTVATQIYLPYMTMDLTGSLPVVTSDEEFMSDTGNYRWLSTMEHQYDRAGDMTAAQVDLKFFVNSKVIPAIKVGGRYSDASSDNTETPYNWKPLAPGWANVIEGDPNPGEDDIHLNTYDNFFGGKVSEPANVYAPLAHWALDFPGSYEELQGRFKYYDDPTTSWDDNGWMYWQPLNMSDDQYQNDQSEKTTAAYVMAEYEFDWGVPVSGNFGVRYVKTENTAHGFLTYPDNELFSVPARDYVAIDAKHDYSNVLPSFNMKVELAEDLIMRFAAAKAIARQDFSQLSSNMTLSASYQEENIQTGGKVCGQQTTETSNDKSCYDLTGSPSTTGANPYREPMESTQFDFSLEWYYEEGSSAYLALFKKDIKGYETKEVVQETYKDHVYNVERYGSDGEADIQGVEVSLTHWFKGLEGFGFAANYTYIDSSTDVSQGTEPVDTDLSTYDFSMPFEGISEHNYNIQGMYSGDKLEVRLAYNWRSEYLMAVGANGYNDGGAGWYLPVYNSDGGYLDGSIKYNINDNFSIQLEANNLADTITKNTVKQTHVGDYTGAYHKNDIRYALSLTGTF